MKQERVLADFFSGTFHQDWSLDDPTWEAAIESYKVREKGEHEGSPQAVSEAILNFSNKFSTDVELEKALLPLGCYYLPSANGMTAKEWLQKITQQLVS